MFFFLVRQIHTIPTPGLYWYSFHEWRNAEFNAGSELIQRQYSFLCFAYEIICLSHVEHKQKEIV